MSCACPNAFNGTCATTRDGCLGGYLEEPGQIMFHRRGILREVRAPYTAKSGTCPQAGNLGRATVEKADGTPHWQFSREDLQRMVARGPVNIAMLVTDDFGRYSGGIFTCPSGLPVTAVNHAVAVVGYNFTSKPPYWIIKNSWSTKWGDKGYWNVYDDGTGAGPCNLRLWAVEPQETTFVPAQR